MKYIAFLNKGQYLNNVPFNNSAYCFLGLVSPLHAISFAIVCSTTGIGMLYFGANGLAAALGAVNLVLYTSVYTPMKRLTIVNTWTGAVGKQTDINLLDFILYC